MPSTSTIHLKSSRGPIYTFGPSTVGLETGRLMGLCSLSASITLDSVHKAKSTRDESGHPLSSLHVHTQVCVSAHTHVYTLQHTHTHAHSSELK